jgi:DNA mismatch repair protein MutS2
MNIVDRSLESIEWPSYLARYAHHCQSTPAKEKALHLEFPESIAESEALLSLTDEAYHILEEEYFTSLSNLEPLDHTLQRAAKESVLEGKELYHIYRLIMVSQDIVSFFNKRKDPTRYAHLYSLVAGIENFSSLRAAIQQAIEPDGTVKDSASPRLQGLRSQERKLHQEARSKLEDTLQQAFRDGLAQDRYMDIRDGRYLLPIKSEHRHKIPGLIYESSATLATVFIEPAPVRELNDKLNQVLLDIQDEIYIILKTISEQVWPNASALRHAYEQIVLFDLTLARGRMAQYYEGVRGAARPVFGENIFIEQLYHPLLPFVIEKEKIVRNTFHLDGKRILIISGPNTGGKTVLLKALGLASLMAKCGFFVPCMGTAQVPFFTSVLSQIGDEQNIEQSLSSFSASVMSIKSLLEHADAHTLILIDEILHSTDPDEASALSQAILQELDARGSTVIVTTHLNGLKLNKNESFMSASMEFDAKEMQPTYRLRLGIPGSSRALEIGERLGLSSRLIQAARGFLEKSYNLFDEQLNKLEQKERELEAERASLQKTLADQQAAAHDARLLARQFQEQKSLFQKTAKERLQHLERQAMQEVERVTEEYKGLIKDFKERHEASLAAKERVRYVRQQFQAPEEEKKPGEPSAPIIADEEDHDTPTLRLNGSVMVKTIKSKGTLLSDPAKGGKNAVVLVGNMKMNVPWEKLEPLAPTPQEIKAAQKRAQVHHETVDCPPELNLIGKKAEEARDALELYIDKAARSGRPSVRVVHGFGTGALRKTVRDYLTKSHYDITFRSGESSEGGDGCTVVEFK